MRIAAFLASRVRLLLIISMVLAAAGLLALFIGTSADPIEMRVVRIQPAQTNSPAGTPLSIVTISISNRNTVGLLLENREQKVQARVANRWEEMPAPFILNSLRPAQESEILIVVPAAADACRIAIDYEPPKLRSRFFAWLPSGLQQTLIQSPKLKQWMWAQQRLAWKSAVHELTFPRHE